jgi:hypothetical protein
MTDQPLDPPAGPPGPPDQPNPPQQPEQPSDGKKDADLRAFLPIGIVFFAVGITFVAQESTRGLGFAFFAIGLAFVVMSSTGRSHGKQDPKATPDPSGGQDPRG